MQLVELQRTIHEDRGRELAVAAISYDPVPVLASFATKHDITYPLLSDEGSAVITRLGLLNHQIRAERAHWGRTMEPRYEGLPFPGTFLLDEDGVITEKLFQRSHRVRPSGSMLLDRLGESRGGVPERAVTATSEGIVAAVWSDEETYFPNQWQRLHVRLIVDDGLHLYVPPVPDGYHALQVSVDGPDELLTNPTELPTGHPLSIEILNETFSVAEGTVDAAVPFYVLDGIGDVDISVNVQFQACTDETCFIPQTLSVPLRVPADPSEV